MEYCKALANSEASKSQLIFCVECFCPMQQLTTYTNKVPAFATSDTPTCGCKHHHASCDCPKWTSLKTFWEVIVSNSPNLMELSVAGMEFGPLPPAAQASMLSTGAV